MIKRKDRLEHIESVHVGSGKSITHSFLTRKGGVSTAPFASLNFSSKEGDSLENIQYNERAVGKAFGFSPSSLITLNQVHGNKVILLKKPGEKPLSNVDFNGDAIITNQRGFALGILTADCLPILIDDPSKGVIGAVHAGWKGTSLRIVQKTLLAMEKFFEVKPDDVKVALGPSIGPCCYEVDDKVLKPLRKNLTKEMIPVGKRMLNLAQINRKLLLEMGVKEESIELINICTSCRKDLFFSYRRDGKTGRQLSFIMLN
jgi:hypothetical protein